uniref:Uncharacterized protein n=1 Tax=Rhipicephalus microplus TaxID=6941 RepID=A0A6G5AG61_RHIMP
MSFAEEAAVAFRVLVDHRLCHLLFFSYSLIFSSSDKGDQERRRAKKKCEGWNTLYRCSSHLSVCLLLLRAPLSSKVGGTTTRLKTTLFFFVVVLWRLMTFFPHLHCSCSCSSSSSNSSSSSDGVACLCIDI